MNDNTQYVHEKMSKYICNLNMFTANVHCGSPIENRHEYIEYKLTKKPLMNFPTIPQMLPVPEHSDVLTCEKTKQAGS